MGMESKNLFAIGLDIAKERRDCSWFAQSASITHGLDQNDTIAAGEEWGREING